MGTIRNEMTIVHSGSKDRLEKVREDAVKMLTQIVMQDAIVVEQIEDIVANMVSPIMSTYVNGEYTFVINGDGSKLGWKTSEVFHDARMKWCEKHKCDAFIIVINFGEGGEPCHIEFDNT